MRILCGGVISGAPSRFEEMKVVHRIQFARSENERLVGASRSDSKLTGISYIENIVLGNRADFFSDSVHCYTCIQYRKHIGYNVT
jgi:hypothetical protein